MLYVHDMMTHALAQMDIICGMLRDCRRTDNLVYASEVLLPRYARAHADAIGWASRRV